MHTTFKHDTGWFPVIGIRFERLSDLLVILFAFALGMTVLIYLLMIGRKLLTKTIKALSLLLLGFILHIGILTAETAVLIFHTIQKIPLSWYSVVGLTIIPIAVDIPRQAAIWYLLAYCVSNGWIATFGVNHHCSKKHESAPIKGTNSDPKITTQIKASEIQSQLFTGMRISIQQ
jgi:hypothetical protein